MLESLLFVFLMLIAGLFLLLTIILLIVALIIKSSILKRVAFAFGIIPIACLGIAFVFYFGLKPYQNQSDLIEYSGTYVSESNYNSKLFLKADGTYKTLNVDQLRLPSKGTWRTGGIDGFTEFLRYKRKLKGKNYTRRKW